MFKQNVMSIVIHYLLFWATISISYSYCACGHWVIRPFVRPSVCPSFHVRIELMSFLYWFQLFHVFTYKRQCFRLKQLNYVHLLTKVKCSFYYFRFGYTLCVWNRGKFSRLFLISAISGERTSRKQTTAKRLITQCNWNKDTEIRLGFKLKQLACTPCDELVFSALSCVQVHSQNLISYFEIICTGLLHPECGKIERQRSVKSSFTRFGL